VTGVTVPIALSYSLQGIINATPLQAFAAGAALCSTSLGTTFAILASSGLSSTRLGVVLTSAAMMDDVVGLVMVQIISKLGGGSVNAVTIVRPVLVSLAFAVVIPLACCFIVTPATNALNRFRQAHPAASLSKLLLLANTPFVIQTLLLIALVAGATYAGTSNLFAAYVAGATISWWDSDVPHPRARSGSVNKNEVQEAKSTARIPTHDPPRVDTSTASAHSVNSPMKSVVSLEDHAQDPSTSGLAIYEQFYRPANQRLLQPFFFASIGFSIPITRMFTGSVVWRGIVYAALMTFGKLVCGLWLVHLPIVSLRARLKSLYPRVELPSIHHSWDTGRAAVKTENTQDREQGRSAAGSARAGSNSQNTPSTSVRKSFSLQPSLILALAMVARGEIGFLISAVAETNGIFSSPKQTGSESELFLIVTWAIFVCTIIGPLGVGLCVRRVKRLEASKDSQQEGVGRDVLGVWGVG
jgi:hypothetical protein